MAPKTVEHSVLAFYGMQGANIKCIYENILVWFKRYNLRPTHMAVNRQKSGDFQRTANKVVKTQFEAVTSFDLTAFETDEVGLDTPLWIGISTETDRDCFYFNISSYLCNLNAEQMALTAAEMMGLVHPRYGIGFTEWCAHAGTFWVDGITYGNPTYDFEEEEDEEGLNWGFGLVKKVYEQGILRDLFPLIFLNNTQLTMPIEGRELRAWITEDIRRGVLRKCCGGLTLWKVSKKDMPGI